MRTAVVFDALATACAPFCVGLRVWTEASAIIEAQYDDQRHGMEALARGLQKAGRLREGWSVARAAAALHALTSVETFMLLRRDQGLPLAKVKQTIAELSRTMLSAYP